MRGRRRQRLGSPGPRRASSREALTPTSPTERVAAAAELSR